MSTKFVRFFAALAVMVSIFGNSGVVRADHGAAPGVGVQNLNLPRAPQPHPLDRPALTISPPSSLGSQFVHIATAANSVSDYTIINNSLTNGNPSAILIVTPNWNPGGVGGTFDNHPIGVYYVGGKWTIFNQDITPIPVGAAFNVIIPTSGAGVFVQTVTPANIGGEVTFIDNALINANPNAIMLVTPNYNPGGGCGCIYDNHPIGVYYSTASGNQWGIFNQDNVAMPLNASFNVFVLAAGADVFVHTATAGNSAGDYTTIDDALTNRNPNAIVFVTQNANPGSAVAYNNHNIGVYYNSAANRWRIFNQDNISAVTANTSFNVLVLASDIFVHRATAGNSSGNVTLIDNVLTNSNPNAIVFTTPNYNPSGAGGTYNNHNIGVIYRILENQIAIFNQDAVAMPTTAAFNVLIPNPDTSVFVQKATVSNITSNWTTIDYPLTNGKPNAIVLVTPNWNPSGVGATFDNHPIGVSYDGSKWNIFNQDLAAMPVNASFNVTVPTAGTGTGVFVHTATAPNISGNWTAIDYPLTNGNPNAIIIATPNYNPGGAGGIYDDHPIGVWYNGSKWSIFNQDLAAMPVNASFNLYVVGNYKLYLPLIFR